MNLPLSIHNPLRKVDYMVIAEKAFIISSSQQRIWEILMKAVLRFMPLERMKPQSEKSVRALLRVKMGLISLPLDVEVEIVDASPPTLLVTTLRAKGMGGVIWLNQRSTFTLTSISEGKTEVACKIAEEGMAILLRVFFLKGIKDFAGDAFSKLEERLRQWA